MVPRYENSISIVSFKRRPVIKYPGYKEGENLDSRRREELFSLLKALRRSNLSDREIYHAIQTFGETNFQEARPEVEHFLTSENPELRFVALKVLTRYWHLNEHWQTARYFLEHDPDEDVRFRAASALAGLRQNTQDRATLTILAQVVLNEQEADVVRIAAYAAMKAIMHYDPREQFDILKGTFDVQRKVDWEWVRSFLREG